ncbi:MAG: leucine-rich repeat domain-containing protein, partial [Planctomycetota bacterium]
KHLYFRGNNLTELSSQIGNLTKLERINLSGNRFDTLPEEIENLENLKSCHITFDIDK